MTASQPDLAAFWGYVPGGFPCKNNRITVSLKNL